jgi:hypothetical protein
MDVAKGDARGYLLSEGELLGMHVISIYILRTETGDKA